MMRAPTRDVLARQPVRVAAPVEPLVVVADHRGDLGVADAARHHRAVDRVALDQRELAVGQAPGLVEDGARRVQLADVVQRGGRADLGDLGGRQPHRGGDPLGVARHALRVAVGARVTRLQQLAEVDQRLEAGALRIGAEQLLGLGQPPLGDRAAQPAPQHQVGEHAVLRPGETAPDRAADARRGQRQRHAEQQRERQQSEAAGGHQQRDEHGRQHDDERGRDHRMGQPSLRAWSPAGCGNTNRHWVLHREIRGRHLRQDRARRTSTAAWRGSEGGGATSQVSSDDTSGTWPPIRCHPSRRGPGSTA